MKNTLEKDFKLRKSFFSNRASAIFPIYFLSHENDLILSWLNYWKIKNNIPSNTITINLRVYEASGQIFEREVLHLEPDNNYISIRKLIREKIFSGMVEIEIISTSNIAFTFPAVIGFYKSGSLYSCVHSSGRIKGSDENHSPIETEETNWSCKFTKNISPFFHYFNGSSEEKVLLKINLFYQNGDIFDSRDIITFFKPFGSKLYFIDELFGQHNFEEGMFVGVKCQNDSVFRRMVVGNFHKNLQHLEVTHSFARQETPDYCPKNENGSNALLAIFSDPQFSLQCRVFPTNCSYEFEVSESSQKYIDKKLNKVSHSKKFVKRHGVIDLENDNRMNVLLLDGNKVPSRLNTNFIYKIKNVESVFSTDIATGAKSSVYPPKHSHWGSGIYGNGYDFIILLRNVNHSMDSNFSKGKLKVFGLDKSYEFEVEVGGNSSRSLILSELLRDNSHSLDISGEHIFSWYLNLDGSNSETFWLSYRKEDGCIFGEHGF